MPQDLNRHDDGDDENDRDDPSTYVPTVTDHVRYLRYTLLPTLYTDENSSTNDLLWQQVLEQRGIRTWLAVIGTIVIASFVVALLAGIVVAVALVAS